MDNREILFRGFHENENGKETIYLDGKEIKGKWVYGFLYITSKGEYEISYYSKAFDIERYTYVVIPETLGQFTGLTDKNDKKIFEGDIIRYADLYDYNCYLESIDNPEVYDNIDLGNIWTIDEVVYGIKVGYPAFDLNKHDFETNGLSELSENGHYFYEVIGNIFSNPELLRSECE